MKDGVDSPVSKLLGPIPTRLQLAGGWIDQPFISALNPEPPGSMVVVQIEPDFPPMDRAGIATGTRAIAAKLWNNCLPERPYADLVRELYAAENEGKADPSGSQDMIGLVYPGVNRLDYDIRVEGGVFPVHIESCNSTVVARWLEKVLHLLPIGPRPEGYSPLGIKKLEPEWVARLGQSGRDCFDAIVRMDMRALGASLNLNMRCWEKLLPHVVRHPLIRTDLMALLGAYQQEYAGAMFSGCGGGYLIVVSEDRVPGALNVTVRVEFNMSEEIVVSGPFDDIRSPEIRFLEEASRLGRLTVLLWPDAAVQRIFGRPPKFPFPERRYLLDAVRYVDNVVAAGSALGADELPGSLATDVWADCQPTATPQRQSACRTRGIAYRVIGPNELSGFPTPTEAPSVKPRKVVVTGCYDWLHSGHVRFFEEVSQYGDLFVILGHDANIRHLKGDGHPLQPQEERRYCVGAIKYVRNVLIASGSGWLDADPEIQRLKPDIYAVNEDGDRGGKREYCLANGIEYLVLDRVPAPGLPRRSSTDLRGF